GSFLRAHASNARPGPNTTIVTSQLKMLNGLIHTWICWTPLRTPFAVKAPAMPVSHRPDAAASQSNPATRAIRYLTISVPPRLSVILGQVDVVRVAPDPRRLLETAFSGMGDL